jgi:hypothetical protein
MSADSDSVQKSISLLVRVTKIDIQGVGVASIFIWCRHGMARAAYAIYAQSVSNTGIYADL